MAFYNLRIPREHVYDIVNILGSFSVAQLVDSKPNELHRPYLNTIKRCEESLTKIGILGKRARECGLEVHPPEDINEYLRELSRGIAWLIQRWNCETSRKALSSTKSKARWTPSTTRWATFSRRSRS